MSNVAFARASVILDALSETGAPQHINVLEHKVRMRRNSLEKVLEILVHHKWAMRRGDMVTLGTATRDWGFAALSLNSLPEKAAPMLLELFEKTGLDAAICVYAPPSVVFVKTAGFTNHPNAPQIGVPYTAHVMANGRSILATYPKAYLDQYIEAFLSDQSPEWIKQKVIDPVEEAREMGFGMTTGDRVGEIEAICFPIMNISNQAVASISLWRPVDQIEDTVSDKILAFVPILRLLANRMSESLGASSLAA
jgi:DNA-binding IclR family transcriptional regulator